MTLTRLDHIVLRVADGAAAVRDYERLFGRRAERSAWSFERSGIRLEEGDPTGPSALVFATDDLDACAAGLRDRGLTPDADDHGLALSVRGVDVRIVDGAQRPSSKLLAATRDDAVARVDHVVVVTPGPDAAQELYKDGLGLRLATEIKAFGMRLQFFRVGGVTVELVSKPDAEAKAGDGDSLWGVSYWVPDVGGAHARMGAAEFQISEVRAGRRPDTDVFTVRGPTHGTATLVIGPTVS